MIPFLFWKKNIVFKDKNKTKTTVNNSDNNLSIEELEKISLHINDLIRLRLTTHEFIFIILIS